MAEFSGPQGPYRKRNWALRFRQSSALLFLPRLGPFALAVGSLAGVEVLLIYPSPVPVLPVTSLLAPIW